MCEIMDKKLIFKILEIEETKDERLIKNAYRTKLSRTNPEDDPEGFKQLREAYEAALSFMNTDEEDEEQNEPDTPISLWIKDAEKIYAKRSTRTDLLCWKELLGRDILNDFETSDEAREAFLVFLMSRFRFPIEVWDLIDSIFEFELSKKELYEKFPPNFVDFVTDTPSNKSWINFKLFEGDDEADVDLFIENYLTLRNINDYRDFDKYEEALKAVEEMDIYHPYVDVEKLRFYLYNDKSNEALEIAEALNKLQFDDMYIAYYIALIHSEAGKTEMAFEEVNAILEINSNHFGAKYILAKCYAEKEEYEQAKTLYMELLELDAYNESLIEGFQKVNEKIKEIHQKRLVENPNDKESRLELGWCLLQDNLCQECVDLVEGMEIDEENSYNYYNLIGRVYLYMENYDKAYGYLQDWLKEIDKLQDDGTEKTQKRIRRRSLAYYFIAKCHNNFSKSKEDPSEELIKCIEYLDRAIEIEEIEKERLRYMLEKAEAYIRLKEDTKCIDVCDEIIKNREDYYPAYVFRQEAYYNLRMAQEVIDDFYRATEIYSGDAKPYIFAMKAFMGYRQYDDALGILNKAKEAKIESNELEYNELVIKGFKTEGEEALVLLAEELKEFYEKLIEDPGDIRDASDTLYQLALCYYNMKDYELALKTVNDKLEQSFSSGAWVLRADSLYALERYNEAAEEYEALVDNYEDYVYGYYQLGSCHMQNDDEDLAIEAFEKVIELEPDHNFVYNDIKDIYKSKYRSSKDIEDYTKAVEYALKQVELVPDVYYYNELGLLYLTGYDLEKAVEAFEEALKYKEDDMYSYNNMGFAYKIMGQFEKAHQCYEMALKYQKNNDLIAHGNLATYYRITRQFEKSIETYKFMLEISQNPRNIKNDLYQLYLNMGAWDEAIELSRDINEVEDQAQKKTSVIGSVKKLFGFKSKDESPELTKGYMEYLGDVADIEIYRGNYEQAEIYYREALKLFPKESAPYTNMGHFVRHIIGDMNAALKYYQDAYEIAKNYDEDFSYIKDDLLENLAIAYLGIGDMKNAQKYIKDVYNYYKGIHGSIELWLSEMSYRKIRLFKIASWKLMFGEREEANKYKDLMFKSHNCRGCDYAKCFEYALLEGMFMEADSDYKAALAKYEEALSIAGDDIMIIGKIRNMKKILEENK